MGDPDRLERVAMALAEQENTPYGDLKLEGEDELIDTRPSYRREAARFIAMFDALMADK